MDESQNRSVDLVSLVIPAHDAEAYLSACIDSVLTQKDVGIEVIVVENGSTDATLQVAQAYGDKIKLLQSRQGGAQGARNVGLAAATGNYLKFFDADDVLLPDVLAEQLAQAKAVEAVDPRSIVYGDLEQINGAGEVLGLSRFRPCAEAEHPLGHILFAGPVTGSPLHQTELVREVGGMDESLHREHETNLHFRLLLTGVRMVHFSNLIYQYRQHGDDSSLMGGGVARFGALWPFEYLAAREQDLVQYFNGSIPMDVKIALARKYWRDGRAILREGFQVESVQYFRRAKELAGRHAINGSEVYRFTTTLLGPRLAEKLNPARWF